MSLFGSKQTRGLAVDFGSHSFKVVELEREGDGFAVKAFACKPIPPQPPDRRSAKDLAAVLKGLLTEMQSHSRQGEGLISPSTALLRLLDLPQMPLPEIHRVVKTNSQRYLHQDCVNYAIDCHVVSSTPETKARPDSTPVGGGAGARIQVLVGAAPQAEVNFYVDVMTQAGLRPNSIGLSAVALLNAFEVNQGDVFAKETFALVDAGHTVSTMFVVQKGVPVLTRTLQYSGRRALATAARSLNVSEEDADKEVQKMAENVQKAIQRALDDLANEIRDSVDFFEHQRQIVVTKVFLSGGFARQPFVQQSLQKSIGLPCAAWNPCQKLSLQIPDARKAELELQAPLLVGAIGAALAYSKP